jgi:hypothetical protein
VSIMTDSTASDVPDDDTATPDGTATPDDSVTSNESADSATPDVDPGPAQVRTPPVIETDPVLVHVGETIDDAKEAAREIFGEEGSGVDDEVDPDLGSPAQVP